MPAPTPVAMIGLDAADLVLVRRWIGEGRLPNLQRLAARGHFAELASPAAAYAGGVWPSFYTGRSVAAHGVYHNKLWRADAMRIEVPTDAWLGARPFHEHASAQGLRVCVVDLPMVLGPPRPLNGIYVGGWGTHDLIARGARPEALWAELERRHGPPLMPPEHFGRQDKAALLALRDQLLRSTEQMQAIAIDLLSRERWDLACIVLGAAHRGGHYLWDLSQLDPAALTPGQRDELEAALPRLYEALDHAVGEICRHLPANTLVMLFAVHGMGPNPGWSDLLPDLLAAVRSTQGAAPARTGLLYALKRRLPFHWVRPLLTRLPPWARDRLVASWSRRMFDWSSTTDFPLPMDHAGYWRINLAGRERQGIVPPGAAYDERCAELAELILSLHDADTGEPLAAAVTRPWQEAPAAEQRDLLPDLLVGWAGPCATRVRRVGSTLLQGWSWPVPPRLPSGRSGNHLGHGWLIAAGPDVVPGAASTGHDILDLVPTAAARLGLAPDPAWEGRPLPLGGSPP